MAPRTWSSETGPRLAAGGATRSATVLRQPERPSWPRCSSLVVMPAGLPGERGRQADVERDLERDRAVFTGARAPALDLHDELVADLRGDPLAVGLDHEPVFGRAELHAT